MVNVAVDIPGATNDRSVSENTLQDTHALQSSTRKSRQSSLHHRLTMNDTWIFILTNPATDQLVAANHAFYQILGFEQKTVIGRTTVELKLFADIHQRNVSLAKLQKEEIGDALATTIRSADGREKFCIETTELVHLQGQSYAATLLQLAVDSNMTLFAADDERFNKVFSSTPNIAIQGYSADGSIHYWNAASERLYGYSAEEAVGKNLVELIIPQEMRDVVRGMISAGAETGIMPPAAELMLQHKNGDSVPVYSSHVVVFLPEKPPEFYCIDVDLKTQWLREQRLGRITSLLLNLEQDAQKNFQRILDLCGELLGADCALYNRLDGDLLCLISGWNAPSDIQEQDDPQGHLCFDVISRKEDGVLCVRNLQNTIYSQTDPNVAKYGLQTYIGHPVRFGGKNQGSLCVVFTRDVEPTAEDLTILGLLASALAQEEERLQAHQELIERDQFEKVLIDHVLAGVALVDAETLKVEKINPAARAMLGLQEDQVIEDLCQKFFCSSDDGLCPLKDIGITVDNAECELQRADGKRLHVQKSVQRVKIQGKEKFVECFVDISSHKNIQKILQQERDLLERASVAGQVALWDWDVKHNILDWTSYIDS
ncbi:MAG: PAS domain S-box protein, partial [Calditrichaeota bacterium]